jgi:hypothetical protein
MNIFFLHVNPSKSASFYFNKHCIKIILEIAQMLYTAHYTDPNWTLHPVHLKPYRRTHANHPTSLWVRRTKENYLYACTLGLELCKEYTQRYGKVHKTEERLKWLLQHPPQQYDCTPYKNNPFLATANVPEGCTPIPLAMPMQFHQEDVIEAYRMYYITEKKHVGTYKRWVQLKKLFGLLN